MFPQSLIKLQSVRLDWASATCDVDVKVTISYSTLGMPLFLAEINVGSHSAVFDMYRNGITLYTSNLWIATLLTKHFTAYSE